MKKFLDKEQIIELKKGEFVNAYIFKNIFDKLKGKPFIFRENSILNKKKQRFSNHGLPLYYGEKGKINVHRFSSMAIDKYSVPLYLIKEIRKQKEQKEFEEKNLKKMLFLLKILKLMKMNLIILKKKVLNVILIDKVLGIIIII